MAIVAKSQKRPNTALEASGILLVEETDEYGNTISPASGSAVSATLDALTITYSYDLFNRLTESKAGKKITGFTYTADDYRLSKSSDTETAVYFYEGDKVAFEEDASGAVTAVNHVGTSTYARTIFEEGAETTFYYRFNAYGDVTALTGTDGTTIAEYEYDAFGNLTSQPDTKVNNSITYRGYEYDAETGLYYLNARYYDSTTARFLTEDTYRGEKNDPLSLNLYTYCKNNPLKYTDPTGHEAVTAALTLVKIFIGIGATVLAAEELIEIKNNVKKIINNICSDTEKTIVKQKQTSDTRKNDGKGDSKGKNSSQNSHKKKGDRQPTSEKKPKEKTDPAKYEIIERGSDTSLTVKYNGSDVSVYRGGNSFEIKPTEIKIDPNTGLVQPTHGVSVNVDPYAVDHFGGAYRIDELPKGLKIIQRGLQPGHYEIVPEYPMPIDIYQFLLRQIKVSRPVLR